MSNDNLDVQNRHSLAMMNRRAFSKLAFAASVMGGASIVGGASAQGAKVLRFVPYADLRVLDPVFTTTSVTAHHAYMIYDTLFSMDEKFVPQPQMVDTYEVSSDKLTYTFKLRDGLLFHDGSAVTAEDAVASIKRWAARDTGGTVLIKLTSRLEAIDQRTFRLVLSAPFGLVLDTLASPPGPFVMPKDIAATDPFQQIQKHIGSGPFVFNQAAWVPGSRVIYDRFDKYVPRSEPASELAGGKRVKVDRVEWRHLPDPATAIAALQNGEVDYYEAPPIDLLPVLRANRNITVGQQDPLGRIVVMRPNHLHPPFNTKEGRQALSYMVNQREYMAAIAGDSGQTCSSLMMCGAATETNVGGGDRMVASDMAKAKELMAKVYKGETVVVLHPTDHVSGPAALITAARLRELGVRVDLQAMDFATLSSRRTSKNPPSNGGWSIIHAVMSVSAATPVSHLGVAAGPSTAWFGWPENAKIEELRLAWGQELDQQRRKAIMDQLHTEMMDYQPFIQLGQIRDWSAWRSNLRGVIKSFDVALWAVDVT